VTAGAVVEVGGAQRARRLRERFEQRLEFPQTAPPGVGDSGVEPGFDRHRRSDAGSERTRSTFF
jgi:hypothetical protein